MLKFVTLLTPVALRTEVDVWPLKSTASIEGVTVTLPFHQKVSMMCTLTIH